MYNKKKLILCIKIILEIHFCCQIGENNLNLLSKWCIFNDIRYDMFVKYVYMNGQNHIQAPKLHSLWHLQENEISKFCLLEQSNPLIQMIFL